MEFETLDFFKLSRKDFFLVGMYVLFCRFEENVTKSQTCFFRKNQVHVGLTKFEVEQTRTLDVITISRLSRFNIQKFACLQIKTWTWTIEFKRKCDSEECLSPLDRYSNVISKRTPKFLNSSSKIQSNRTSKLQN